MDYRSDSDQLATVACEPTRTHPDSAAVTCDQAIFTCIRSALGQGYRIVAASNGLHHTESVEIASRSPSGDGLCDNTPTAFGVAFVPLSTGRYAVLHSTYAGKEPTGRGGLRAYTRAFVLDADALRRFHNNPFDVLRAAEAAGLLRADLTPARTLQPARLITGTRTARSCFAAAMSRVGHAWITHCVEKLLSDETVIVHTTGDLPAVAEAVLLSVPGILRPAIALSAGVRFSIARLARLTVIHGEAARAQQAVRGRSLAFADTTRTPPHPPGHPWALAVERFLTSARTDRLLSLTGDGFNEADVAEIERIGNACLDLDNLDTAQPAEVIDTAAAYLERPVRCPLGETLSHRIIERARGRLNALLSQAGAAELAGIWRDLAPPAGPSPQIISFASEVAGLAIARMSALAPLEAIRMTIEAADRGWFARVPEELRRVADSVVARVAAWTASATAPEMDAARSRLTAWCRRFPNDTAASQLLSCIEQRLAG
ncbi:MAG: hypothetical protein ACPMAQ_06495 [Phycisphaerae bacterium]